MCKICELKKESRELVTNWFLSLKYAVMSLECDCCNTGNLLLGFLNRSSLFSVFWNDAGFCYHNSWFYISLNAIYVCSMSMCTQRMHEYYWTDPSKMLPSVTWLTISVWQTKVSLQSGNTGLNFYAKVC